MSAYDVNASEEAYGFTKVRCYRIILNLNIIYYGMNEYVLYREEALITLHGLFNQAFVLLERRLQKGTRWDRKTLDTW